MTSGVYPHKSPSIETRKKKSEIAKRLGIKPPVLYREKHGMWKGGKINDGQGYVKIYNPDHPFNSNGYVLEHRLVMEKKIGRYLRRKEIVHHKNGVKDDNRLENLTIMSISEHTSYHRTGTLRKESTKQKIREKLLGHKHSEETLKKIRISVRKAYSEGKKIGFQKGNYYGTNNS